MKIAIIGPAHPLRGGIANFNEALCFALHEAGHQSSIYSFSLQYPGFLFPGTTQFDDGPAPEGLSIHTTINSVNPLSWNKTARKIAQESPDLVLIRYWLPFMGLALGTIARKLRKKGIRVIAITDNIIPHESRPGDRRLTRYFVKHCDGFMAMSKAVLKDLEQFTDNPKKDWSPHPVYNIFGKKIEKEEARKSLGLELDQQYVLFFGFVRKYKGLDLLLEAFAQKRLQDLGVKLLVAGEFYDKKAPYLEIIQSAGIEAQVILHDHYISKEKVAHYFCAANLIAQTYRSATQSGVSQIAYHFERPLLVTDVGGLSEIVPNNKVGFVTKPDSNDIADAIAEFFKEQKEEEFKKNMQIEKQRFEWSYFVDRILKLYQSLE